MAFMPLDHVMRLPDREDGTVHFQVDGDEMYPIALDLVVNALESGEAPTTELRQEFIRAQKVDPKGWNAAHLSHEECPPKLREARADALESARRWFTNYLHNAVGKSPMIVTITPNPKWRL